MRSILHRSFNVLQWEALVLLVAGITVNQLNYCTKDAAGARSLSDSSFQRALVSAPTAKHPIGPVPVPSTLTCRRRVASYRLRSEPRYLELI